MKHPDPKCQEKQEAFLKQCNDDNLRDFHARLFRIGNASYIYHQHAILSVNNETLKIYYEEWIGELPSNLSVEMKKKGFEYCKSALPFTRYVNEREDIGIDEWMKEHLSNEDYQAYKSPQTNVMP